MDFYQTNIEDSVSVSEGDVVAITYREIESDEVVTRKSTVSKTIVPEGWESVRMFYLAIDDGELRCRVTSGTSPSVAVCESETGRRKPVGHLLDVGVPVRPTVRITDEMVRAVL